MLSNEGYLNCSARLSDLNENRTPHPGNSALLQRRCVHVAVALFLAPISCPVPRKSHGRFRLNFLKRGVNQRWMSPSRRSIMSCRNPNRSVRHGVMLGVYRWNAVRRAWLRKKDIIAQLVEDAHRFRFCGPSDDPDEQTAVTAGYRHLVIQLKRLAGPLLPAAEKQRLDSIEVEINNIYSAYDARAEIDALLPDIEAVLERCDESGLATPARVLVPELPQRVLDTYCRLWQLETWLRRLVYVELRAAEGDEWELRVSNTAKPKEADKRLTHMPSPEENSLSYAQLSGVCRIMENNWRLFEPFLPPKSIWEAKLEEVSQVRHRVAHFRNGHEDDLQRVTQLLRDIDKGFWRFCTCYNDPRPILPQSNDPVEEHFLHLDQFPWGASGDGKWARTGIADPEAILNVTVEVLCRPWATWKTPIAGSQGFLYNVHVGARHGRVFDYVRLLKSTSRVHICLDSLLGSFRVTLPAVLGAERVIGILERFVDASMSCVSHRQHGGGTDGTAQLLADSWPEYVLGPENPLTFLEPEMPCSFFGV